MNWFRLLIHYFKKIRLKYRAKDFAVERAVQILDGFLCGDRRGA